MNNRINPYQNGQHLYTQLAKRREGPTPEAGAAQQASATEKPAVAAARSAAGVSSLEGLSGVERQMIERYFPESEAMTLRLYGANRSTQTLNPGAVGGRLDISG
ncbi:MAG: hypothetical protein ACE5G0_18800 [Rhodothermales bacterium]